MNSQTKRIEADSEMLKTAEVLEKVLIRIIEQSIAAIRKESPDRAETICERFKSRELLLRVHADMDLDGMTKTEIWGGEECLIDLTPRRAGAH